MTATTQRKSSRKSAQASAGPTPEEKLVAGLIELLMQGVNPWQREWRGSARGSHRNLITGALYHGSNPALLEMQLAFRASDLPLWAGIGQAKAKGWHPKKGSKGCYIVRPQLNRYTDEAENLQTGQTEEITRQWVSFKPSCVFNASDLQGDGLAEAIEAALGLPPDLSEPERHTAAETTLSNWAVEVNWIGDRAFYSSTSDAITLPPRKQFSSTAGLYATWAHEAIHSTGHADRLGRDGIVNFAGFASDSYAAEELIAELGAFLLCNRLQIDSRIENHAAYLSSWIKALKAQPKTLLKSLSQASAAANLICPEELPAASDTEPTPEH